MDILKKYGRPVTVKEIVDDYGCNPGTLAKYLVRLMKYGLVFHGGYVGSHKRVQYTIDPDLKVT